jgi:integrase
MSRINLTAGAILKFTCPPDKAQAFLRDAAAPGLGVRATKGVKAFIFQGKLADGRTVRTTIGDVRTWGIDDARREARRLQMTIDQGHDPREVRRDAIAEHTEKRKQAQMQQTAALAAWADYIDARRHQWGESYIKQHQEAVKDGGAPRIYGKQGTTEPGILRSLLSRPLAEIDASTMQTWLKAEARTRPTRARFAFALVRAFLNWCADHPDYADLAQPAACASRTVRQELPTKNARKDSVLREQLPAWFAAVRAVRNPIAAAYFQCLLLTGARAGELAALRWEDVDLQWNAMTIRDKVEGERTIPLTPYVRHLLLNLKAFNVLPIVAPGRPRANAAPSASPWVFPSTRSPSGKRVSSITTHKRACAAAGLGPVTLHGLRRSFGSLAEWIEVPAGVVAQIMGHKPSATAEKHYRVRPLDLLRMWHERIEVWILEQAGIEQPNEDKAAQPVMHATR